MTEEERREILSAMASVIVDGLSPNYNAMWVHSALMQMADFVDCLNEKDLWEDPKKYLPTNDGNYLRRHLSVVVVVKLADGKIMPGWYVYNKECWSTYGNPNPADVVAWMGLPV